MPEDIRSHATEEAIVMPWSRVRAAERGSRGYSVISPWTKRSQPDRGQRVGADASVHCRI